MAGKNLDIFIKIREDIAGLQNTLNALKGVDTQVKAVGKSALGLKEQFAVGFGIGAFSQITNQLARLPGAFIGAISEGVKFNATLEGARLGVAAIVKQFDTSGKFKNFDDALGESTKAIDLLKQKALQSPATFEQLVGAFQGVSGAASAANIPLRKQVDLVVLMSQALAGLGIRSDQILQESRALLTGNITEDALAARILGITKGQVDAAKEKGQLFEFLTAKLDAFAEAGQRGQQSFTTQASNLTDALTQLKAVAAESLFEQIKGGLAGVNAELGKAQSAETAAGLGNVLGEVATAGANTLRALQGIGGYLQYLAPAFLGLRAASSDAFDLGKVNQFNDAQEKLRVLLFEQIGFAQTNNEKLEARRALDTAIGDLQARQATASGAMKIALDNALSVLEPMRRGFDDLVGKTAQVTQNITASAAQMRALSDAAYKAGLGLLQIDDELALARAQAIGDEQAILDLKVDQLRQKKELEFQAAGQSPDEAKQNADDLAFYTRANLQRELDLKNAKKEGVGYDRESRDLKRDQVDSLRLLQSAQDDISGNPFLLSADKNAQLIPLLQQEAEAHRAAGDAAAAHRLEMEALSLTFSGGVQANLIQWVNSFGTAAQQVSGILANTVQTAIGGVSQAITGLIFGTKNWAQAISQAAQSIVGNLIQVGLQMIAQKVLGSILTRQNAAEQTAAGAQIAAAHAPAAAATSISSFGSAAVIGGIAAAAAIALIIGLLSGGFKKGGYTGDGDPNQIAGVVHKGEYVIPSNVVKHFARGGEVSGDGFEIEGEPIWLPGNIGRPASGNANPGFVPVSGGPRVTIGGRDPRAGGLTIDPSRGGPGVGGSTGFGTWNTAAGGYLAPGVPSTFATVYATTFTNMGGGQFAARALPANAGSFAAANFGVLGALGGIGNTFGTHASGAFGSGGAGFGPHGSQKLKHAAGGLIDGPGGVDKVPAWLTAGEYVLPVDLTNRIGVGNLERMRTHAGAAHFANGGMVGGGSGGGAAIAPVINQAFFTDPSAAARWLTEQPAGQRQLIDAINGMRVELGLPS